MKLLSTSKAVPVFLGFFVMGFIDLVGIATNYARVDFGLKASVANLLPLMVFLWFALFSFPFSLLMNRTGRKKMVIAGLIITSLSLLLPFIKYNFPLLLVGFAGVGIGNTILQVSVNPLLGNVIDTDKMAAALTGGQLIKSFASLLGPVLVGISAHLLNNWRFTLPLLSAVALINVVWLRATPIRENAVVEERTTWKACLPLLQSKDMILLFLGIAAIVGIDISLNTLLPQLLQLRHGWSLPQAGLATSVYFISRMVGSLIGIFALSGSKANQFLPICTVAGIAGMTGLLFFTPLWLLAVCIVLNGLAVANVFPVLFSSALKKMPTMQNEVSGLMIMGVSGGALFLPLMGIIADSYGLTAALGIPFLLWLFLTGNAVLRKF